MATNFSPCKGSYVLNQFPSNVMFGMNGFHVSASGAIQGHHGPLVFSYGYSNFVSFQSCCLLKIKDKAGKLEIITRKEYFVNTKKKNYYFYTNFFPETIFNFFKIIIP